MRVTSNSTGRFMSRVNYSGDNENFRNELEKVDTKVANIRFTQRAAHFYDGENMHSVAKNQCVIEGNVKFSVHLQKHADAMFHETTQHEQDAKLKTEKLAAEKLTDEKLADEKLADEKPPVDKPAAKKPAAKKTASKKTPAKKDDSEGDSNAENKGDANTDETK